MLEGSHWSNWSSRYNIGTSKGDAEFTVIHTVILILGDSGRQVFISPAICWAENLRPRKVQKNKKATSAFYFFFAPAETLEKGLVWPVKG